MRTFGLVGFPLSHSYSKEYFTRKFLQAALKAQYVNFELESIDGIRQLVDSERNLEGFNVTIPHKQSILPFLDAISHDAREVGAVNTVKIVREQDKIRLVGHNTDTLGFENSLTTHQWEGISSALILGTGGASKAVTYVLKRKKISSIRVSRNRSRNTFCYEDITADLLRNIDFIVNTTPLGMFPDVGSLPNIPYAHLKKGILAYDLVYNPEETMFLKYCADAGCRIQNGLTMLHLQAEAAWRIWEEPES